MKIKKTLTFKDYQNISLNILIDVANFCEENNITYYLGCGTLLGAIRHSGFIPWDDDIDILMPRGDYKKFIEKYRSNNYKVLKPNEGMFFYAKVYDVSTVVYEKMLDYRKVKPIGVSIDIFPLDGMINDKKVENRIRKKSSFFETLLRISNQPLFYKKKIKSVLCRVIARFIGSKNIVRIIESIDQTYEYDKSDYAIRFKETPNGENIALPKEVYQIEKKEFEGHLFNVPKGYKEWLKSFFGDNYMELPSKDKRVSHIGEGYFIED